MSILVKPVKPHSEFTAFKYDTVKLLNCIHCRFWCVESSNSKSLGTAVWVVLNLDTRYFPSSPQKIFKIMPFSSIRNISNEQPVVYVRRTAGVGVRRSTAAVVWIKGLLLVVKRRIIWSFLVQAKAPWSSIKVSMQSVNILRMGRSIYGIIGGIKRRRLLMHPILGGLHWGRHGKIGGQRRHISRRATKLEMRWRTRIYMLGMWIVRMLGERELHILILRRRHCYHWHHVRMLHGRRRRSRRHLMKREGL